MSFDLKTASLEVRKATAACGIKNGQWEPVQADRNIDALPDDAVVAKVSNRNQSIEVTAGDVRYAGQYL